MIDAEAIAKALDRNYRKSGEGFAAKCPAHADDQPSLKITDGKEGRILVHCHAGCDSKAVIAELDRRGLWPKAERQERAPRKAKAAPAPSAPAEAKKPAPSAAPGKIVKTYDYFSPETGELMMQVCRYEPKSFRQRRPDPEREGKWTWSVGKEHRTLYNAARVAKHDRTILIVEGEKDVDRLAELGIVATCNPGGAGKWDPSYSELLRGKDVVLIPDNDPQMENRQTGELQWHSDGRPKHAGQDHMDLVGASLQGIAKSVRILHLPDLPLKGDISDWLDAEGNDRAKLGELASVAPAWAPPVPPERPAEPERQPAPQWEPSNDNDAEADWATFKPLGYDKGNYYFLSIRAQQIIERTASGLSAANLLELAPLEYWTMTFPKGKKESGFDAQAAASALISACIGKGFFSRDMMRGRGAWLDRDRVVLHCGNLLYVDRTPMKPSAINSDHVYEMRQPMEVDIDKPLTAEEGRRLLKLFKMLPWGRDIDALYAAGWCAISHIGGVLPWRPHIWVIGSKGSGKSHVMSAIFKRLLSSNCLFVLGNSSEAGIRQTLEIDAIPVLFDEAEGHDNKANNRLQSVLELVRQSSSETGGKMIKGSALGKATSYQIRSCFAFSSINASLIQQSDRSRVTVVELKQEKQGDFDALQRAENEILTDDFVRRFYARSIAMARTIRANAQTFARAVAVVMGEQRAGDQLGALLAGAYSLTSDDLISYDEATKWVEKQDWSDEKEEVDDMSDERKCLNHILESKLEIPFVDHRLTKTIAEWISTANETEIMLALQREGIHVMRAGEHPIIVTINGMQGIKRLLRNTPWEFADYNKVMARLHGATKLDQSIYIAALRDNKRGLRINLSGMADTLPKAA